MIYSTYEGLKSKKQPLVTKPVSYHIYLYSNLLSEAAFGIVKSCSRNVKKGIFSPG